jgi:hypothetical protein
MKIVDMDEAEEAEWVMCIRKADDEVKFPDNLEGKCTICSEVVIFRPNIPKKPSLICIQCALEQAGGMENLLNRSGTTSEALKLALETIKKREMN